MMSLRIGSYTENYARNQLYTLPTFSVQHSPTPTLKIVHLCVVLGPCFFKDNTKLLLRGIYQHKQYERSFHLLLFLKLNAFNSSLISLFLRLKALLYTADFQSNFSERDSLLSNFFFVNDNVSRPCIKFPAPSSFNGVQFLIPFSTQQERKYNVNNTNTAFPIFLCSLFRGDDGIQTLLAQPVVRGQHVDRDTMVSCPRRHFKGEKLFKPFLEKPKQNAEEMLKTCVVFILHYCLSL